MNQQKEEIFMNKEFEWKDNLFNMDYIKEYLIFLILISYGSYQLVMLDCVYLATVAFIVVLPLSIGIYTILMFQHENHMRECKTHTNVEDCDDSKFFYNPKDE